MPLISVVVPVYNAEKLIRKCVRSLVEQTFRDFEMIFINDGSTDQSLAVLKEINFKEIPTKIITQKNQGQAMARNHGVMQSIGEFICFVDIDDYVEITLLDRLYQKQIESNADIVWCDAFIIRNQRRDGNLDQAMMKNNDIYVNYIMNNAGPWRKIIRRSIITEHHLFFPQIRYYEDVAVVPAYALYAEKITYVDEPLYNYVMHEGSTMNQLAYNQKFEDIFVSMDNLYKLFENAGALKKHHDCIAFIFIDHLLHAASLRFFKYEEGKANLPKICTIMRSHFPNWQSNPYFKQQPWKYRLICKLFYKQQYWLLHKLLK